MTVLLTVIMFIASAFIVLILFGFVLLFIYGIFWCFTPWNPSWVENLVVKEVDYEAARTSTGVGVAGNGGAVVTSSRTPEVYSVVFVREDGSLFIEDCENLYAALNEGDKIIATMRDKTVWGDRCSLEIVDWRKA